MSAILQRDALSEFTVVIMAGGAGSRLAPLTDGLPKALLPVANRPLITHVLETFERAGVKGARALDDRCDAHFC